VYLDPLKPASDPSISFLTLCFPLPNVIVADGIERQCDGVERNMIPGGLVLPWKVRRDITERLGSEK